MDVREKLVELIEESTGVVYGGEYGDEEICPQIDIFDEEIERIADHLIAHGVTVQELDGCEYCRIASYTEKPFTVITQMGREVKTQFNFCPSCGRELIQPPKGE